MDLALACFSNGRERYLDEWKALLAAADERFVLHHVHVPNDSLLGILEVHWDESEPDDDDNCELRLVD